MFKNLFKLKRGLSGSSKLLTPYLRFGFCVGTPYLNPERHITMSHNFNNVYEDIILLGDYPFPAVSNQRVVSQEYVPKIVNLVFDHLNKKYPKAQLDSSKYQDLRLSTWKTFGIDINKELPEILDILSKSIFVKEHKYRFPLEQRQRLTQSLSIYSYFDLNDYFLSFLIETYNKLIQNNVERSHLWKSPKIKGDLSFLEKYSLINSEDPTGIQALKRDIPQNKNIVNRFMDYVHNL